MKIAVITGVFDPKRDMKIEYSKYFDDYDYYCFSCDSKKIEVAAEIKRVILPTSNMDEKYSSRRAGKIPKMLSHLLLPDYDVYVWCDATHEVAVDKEKLLSLLGENDCALFTHPHRQCVYEEAKEVLAGGLDYPYLIEENVKWLKQNNFEKNQGLYEMTTFIRRNNKTSNDVFSFWYSLVSKFSSRDQINFMPSAKKHSLSVSDLEGTAQIYHGGNSVFNQIKPSLRLAQLI